MNRRTLVEAPACCCEPSGPGEPCVAECNDCGPVIATDYCFCITRLVFTQAGGDLASFDLTLSPPLCAQGSCSSYPTIINFDAGAPRIFTINGREVQLGGVGFIKCQEAVGGSYYELNHAFFLLPTGFESSPNFDTVSPGGVGINSTELEPDRCDLDAMLGDYETLYFDIGTGDSLNVYSTLSKGGTCPP